MTKLINADELKKNFPHGEDWDYPVNKNSYVCKTIDNMPTVDAVPVIRCKDCKHCYESKVLICGCPKLSYWCEGRRNLRVEPEDYCSWAERKEE